MTDLLDAIGQPHAQLVLRLALGALLLAAGVAKLTDRAGTRQAVAEYEVLPPAAANAFAALLPWVETSLGVLLLLGLATSAAAALAVPLFLSFAAAISVNLARGRSFDCHCFGSLQNDEIGPAALARALVLALAAFAVAAGASSFGALDALVFGSNGLPPAGEIAPAVLIAFVIFDALALLPELVTFRAIYAGRYDNRPEAVRTHVRPQNGRVATVEVDNTP